MFISFLTNGIGLTQEILLFCNKNQIHLSISLDGNKKIYDNHRKFFNGKGGFDSVIKGINLIKPSFITHSLCCTISPDTISLIPEIFDFFIPFTKMFTIAIGTDNNNFTIKNWDEYLI
jgi:sulfatase maturation enzyme AslB (radical SAM superfamily)